MASLVARRERAWELRREVGITARQDVYGAVFPARQALDQCSDALKEAEESEHADPLVDALKGQLQAAVAGLETALENVLAAKETVNALVHYPLPTE